MKILLVLLLTVATSFAEDPLRQDTKLTPGAINPAMTKEKLCSKAWHTSDERSVSSKLKDEIYKEYSAVPGKGICKKHLHINKDPKKTSKKIEGCEVDHLCSLELGGSNEKTNLWIQPYNEIMLGQSAGAHEKDLVEGWLHREICADRMSLESAQKAIITDWFQLYLQMKQEKE